MSKMRWMKSHYMHYPHTLHNSLLVMAVFLGGREDVLLIGIVEQQTVDQTFELGSTGAPGCQAQIMKVLVFGFPDPKKGEKSWCLSSWYIQFQTNSNDPGLKCYNFRWTMEQRTKTCCHTNQKSCVRVVESTSKLQIQNVIVTFFECLNTIMN